MLGTRVQENTNNHPHSIKDEDIQKVYNDLKHTKSMEDLMN